MSHYDEWGRPTLIDATCIGDNGYRTLFTGSGAELVSLFVCEYCGSKNARARRKQCRRCGAPLARVEYAGARLSVGEARARGLWPEAKGRS